MKSQFNFRKYVLHQPADKALFLFSEHFTPGASIDTELNYMMALNETEHNFDVHHMLLGKFSDDESEVTKTWSYGTLSLMINTLPRLW